MLTKYGIEIDCVITSFTPNTSNGERGTSGTLVRKAVLALRMHRSDRFRESKTENNSKSMAPDCSLLAKTPFTNTFLSLLIRKFPDPPRSAGVVAARTPAWTDRFPLKTHPPRTPRLARRTSNAHRFPTETQQLEGTSRTTQEACREALEARYNAPPMQLVMDSDRTRRLSVHQTGPAHATHVFNSRRNAICARIVLHRRGRSGRPLWISSTSR